MTEQPIERWARDFGYFLGFYLWPLFLLAIVAVLVWWLVRRHRR